VYPRARALPECGGLDQLVRSGRKALQQPVGPFGLLGGAPDNAAHQKELRIMASMPLRVDRLHFNPLRTRCLKAKLDQYPHGLAIRIRSCAP
jgi:hypothetical protein